MPSYEERSRLAKELANQQYLQTQKRRDRSQELDVRVGAFDGRTGRYQVLHADGGVTSNGVPTSNAAPPSDGFVRGLRSADGNAIALGYKGFVPRVVDADLVVDDIEDQNAIKILLFKDNKLWIGGDREDAQEIFDFESVPDGLIFNRFSGIKLTNTGFGLDDWVVLGIANDEDIVNPTVSIIAITVDGFEIQELGDSSTFRSFNSFLGDQYIGARISDQQFIFEPNALPFPYLSQTAYYDYVSDELKNTPFATFNTPNQTLDFDVSDSVSYESTSIFFECNKTLINEVARDENGLFTGALLMSTNDIQLLETIYFGVEEGGVLPSPLALNTPYTVARRSNISITVAAYRESNAFIPIEELIVFTSAGSGTFYGYYAGVTLDNQLAFVDLNRTNYLVFEGEPSPDYNPSANQITGSTYLQLGGYRLKSANNSVFYDGDTVINLDGFEVSLRQYELLFPQLIDNYIVSSGSTISVSTIEDTETIPIILTTFNDDESISTEILETEFIPPTDRFDEEGQTLYLQLDVSIYAEPS